MKPDTLRRWLHRPEARAFIADERNAYLAWATSRNAQVLALIRDAGQNEAARVRAVALLEEMAGLRERPGVSVNVGVQANVQAVGYSYAPCDRPKPATIDATPARAIERPLPDTVLAHRKREAETAVEIAADNEAKRQALAPIFRPLGY
jgi:hypothetical protein